MAISNNPWYFVIALQSHVKNLICNEHLKFASRYVTARMLEKPL